MRALPHDSVLQRVEQLLPNWLYDFVAWRPVITARENSRREKEAFELGVEFGAAGWVTPRSKRAKPRLSVVPVTPGQESAS